jgi:nucleoside triphosphate diphosphatase
MASSEQDRREVWKRLYDICNVLQGPDGCAWDRAQTPESLAPFLIEETHEVFDALACGDPAKLREEIGDALYLWVFFLMVLEDSGRVSLGEAAQGIEEKLTRRHPHVFGAKGAGTDGEAFAHWEQSKRLERPQNDDVILPAPAGIPALSRARRIQEKAAAYGFDWATPSDVIPKLREEIDELDTEIRRSPRSPAVREELGDLLFALVNLARHLDQDPEATLIAATEKFRGRFNAMTRSIEAEGIDLAEASIDVMEAHWQRIKSMDGSGSHPPDPR